MAVKSPTITSLPLPPPKTPKLQSPSSTASISSILALPKPTQYVFPPLSIKTNQRKQQQINEYTQNIQSNLKNECDDDDIDKLSISSHKSPPSPTISNTSCYEEEEEEEEEKTNDDDDDDDTATDDEYIDIFDVFGIRSTNTNSLTWSNIINKYNYTQKEIIGARKLQFELSKLLNITSKTNKYLPPFECIRYFCGCSMETDRAIKKWTYSIKMYREYKMNMISDEEIYECFESLSKAIAFGGYDVDECRIITIKYSLFYFSDYKNINIFLLAGFYLFYYLTHDIKAHRNGITLLCDLNGFNLSNFSFTVEKTGIHFFQKVLPIRIKKVFVLDAPWIAHYALKLVLPLLNEKLRKRVFIVTNNELYHDEINKKIINKKQLPQLVGGTFDNKYITHNHGDTFLFNILTKYFTKTINLNHFNVDFKLE